MASVSDRTVRTYLFGVSDITRQHVLGAHRAAVNAVAISGNYIVSVSGDRSLRVWNAETGALLHTLENHHRRGYVYKHSLGAGDTNEPDADCRASQDCFRGLQPSLRAVRLFR